MSALKKYKNIRWPLFVYDVAIMALVELLLLVFSGEKVEKTSVVYHMILTFVCVSAGRFFGKIYGQVWRYGGIQCYMRLLVTDVFLR